MCVQVFLSRLLDLLVACQLLEPRPPWQQKDPMLGTYLDWTPTTHIQHTSFFFAHRTGSRQNNQQHDNEAFVSLLNDDFKTNPH